MRSKNWLLSLVEASWYEKPMVTNTHTFAGDGGSSKSRVVLQTTEGAPLGEGRGGLAPVFCPALAKAFGTALAEASRTASPLHGATPVAERRNPADVFG